MVLFLVTLAVAVRLPGIARPLVGQFATKNAIYAMIARNWAIGRAPFGLPTIDCMAAGERGWHLLEIPVAAYLAGAGWANCGGSLDVWGRAVSIAFSAAGVALLYLLVRRWHGQRAACAATLVLALSPISILCGQSFMLEASAVFFMLLAIWCWENWLALVSEQSDKAEDRKPKHFFGGSLTSTLPWVYWILATASAALMLCTKIYLAVMLIPLVAMGLRSAGNVHCGRRWTIFGGCATMALVSSAPAAVWCWGVATVASPGNPLSAHVYYSLSRSAAVNSVPNPLLFTADFYLRLAKSLAGAGLTPVGLLLAIMGTLHSSWRRHVSWLLAIGMLVILLPGKFFALRYYILILVPALAVLAGLGWELVSQRVRSGRFFGSACLAAGIGCSLWLAAGPTWTIPPEDRAVTTAAAALREISLAGEPVATLHGAAPDLLYYCDRPGWALSVNDRQLGETLEACRRQGARWLVVADLASLSGKAAADVVAALRIERTGDDYCIYGLASDHASTDSPDEADAGRLSACKIR